MDIKDIRRFRLRKLVATRFNSKQSAFAEYVGKSPSYIARIFSDKPEHSRNIGESLAREIEAVCKLEAGFLDQPLTDTELAGFVDPTTDPDSAKAFKDGQTLPVKFPDASKISVPLLSLPAQLGGSHEQYGDGASVSWMQIDAGWISATLSVSRPENLRAITAKGESMAPTIRQGDLLLVDIGITRAHSDGVYFFYMDGHLVLKRMQRDLEGIRIISDSSRYGDVIVPRDMEDRINIRGKVVYVWSGSQI